MNGRIKINSEISLIQCVVWSKLKKHQIYQDNVRFGNSFVGNDFLGQVDLEVVSVVVDEDWFVHLVASVPFANLKIVVGFVS